MMDKIKDIRVVHSSIEHFDERCGPYGNDKIGLSINDQVIWLASYTYPNASKESGNNYQDMKEIANYIVSLVQNSRACKDASVKEPRCV